MTSPAVTPELETPDLEMVGKAGRRLIWKLTLGLSVAIVVIGLLGLALLGEITASRASVQAQAQCQLDKTIADAVLPAQTSPFGLKISAAARIAYVNADCKLGPLSKPNPRLYPFLTARYR